VENAEEICSVPGIDGIYVGPGDLALTYGLAPTLTPQPGPHADGIRAVVEACERNGIIAGVQCRTGEAAKSMASQGFRMVTVATDAHLLRSGGKTELARAGAITVTEDVPAGPYA
jgi:4-hydroxy-2-oxoheptanedioate aldolase